MYASASPRHPVQGSAAFAQRYRRSAQQQYGVAMWHRAILTAWLLGFMAWAAASARAAPPDLTCAVEGMSRGVKGSELCQALAARLGRRTVLVTDAREAKHGEAVQIISGDVAWTVVWLIDGHVRTWTRVSKIEPIDAQIKLLARAARELSLQAKGLGRAENSCLRLDPEGASKRSLDIAYPWAELSPCKRKVVEVVDPWWLPAGRSDPATLAP